MQSRIRETSCWLKKTEPLFGFRMPRINHRIVVLPAPLCPMMTRRSWGPTTSETLSSHLLATEAHAHVAKLDHMSRRGRPSFSRDSLCHRPKCDSRNLFVFRRSGNACAASFRSRFVNALSRGDFRGCRSLASACASRLPDFARFAALI
jgi:hypothetical protein